MKINIFTKNEIISLIKACDSIGTIFANSAALKRTGGGRAEKMRQTMLSYKNIFVHFYANICQYGEVEDFISHINSEEYGRFALSYALVFSNPSNFSKCIDELPSNWNSVLTVLKGINMAGEDETITAHMSDILLLTDAFMKLKNYYNT